MLEIAFRISEDVIFKTSRGACPHNPWRLLPLVGLRSDPPYHKRGSAPGNGRVTLVILMGRRKQQFVGYLKLKSGRRRPEVLRVDFRDKRSIGYC